MKHYRFTEISGWYRVRDEKNNEFGCGNSQEEALNDCIKRIDSKAKEYKSRARGRITIINKQRQEFLKLRNAFRQLHEESCSQGDDWTTIRSICESVNFDHDLGLFEDE